jgi:hypothetical protein
VQPLKDFYYRSNFMSYRFIPFIILIVFLVLFPTALGKNTGYVDPNLYIGYALDHKWLTSFGFEYHATRIPFIELISVLISVFGYGYFGLSFKVVLILLLIYALNKLRKVLEMNGFAFFVLSFIICSSPMVVSIVSWTIPNGFASLLCLLLIIRALDQKDNFVDCTITGFLITTCLLMNFYGGFLAAIAYFVISISYSKIDTFHYFSKFIKVFGAMLFSGMIYELVWHFIYGIDGSLWIPHFKILLNNDELSENYWGPVLNPLEQSVFTFAILGVLIPVYFLKFRKSELTVTQLKALVGSLSLSLISILLYIFKLNISYTQYFYQYFYLPIFILTLFVVFSRANSNLIFDVLMFLTLYCVFLILIKITSGTILNVLSILMFYLVFFLLSHMLYKKKFKTNINPIFIFVHLASLTLFLNVPFMQGYVTTDNNLSQSLLKDEIQVFSNINELGSDLKPSATWYEPDEAGYRGAIISSLGFHITRLEGRDKNNLYPDVTDWYMRKATIPENLVTITSPNWVWNGMAGSEIKYRLEFSQLLPSQFVEYRIYSLIAGPK